MLSLRYYLRGAVIRDLGGGHAQPSSGWAEILAVYPSQSAALTDIRGLAATAWGETHEGHTSPMYRLTGSPHGALHRGFRRFIEELRRTARQVV